ncbi:MAG: hypothetical protein MZV70_51400 [Desulfobacterales bacterium]|nr:hypothetical protein [Desulfobacterales bacterium]
MVSASCPDVFVRQRGLGKLLAEGKGEGCREALSTSRPESLETLGDRGLVLRLAARQAHRAAATEPMQGPARPRWGPRRGSHWKRLPPASGPGIANRGGRPRAQP